LSRINAMQHLYHNASRGIAINDPSSPSIISVSKLSKTFATGFQALKGIDLDIRRGEIFALLGPNGAGKTTLISIICGIVNPTEGRVTVDGHDILKDYRAARSLIGLVPQELTTDAFESVWGTVSFQSRPLRQARESGAYRDRAQGFVAVGEEGQQDHDAVRRDEAPAAHRQGAVARALDPVFGRADRRCRRRASRGHVGARSLAPGARRDDHPDRRTTSTRPRKWPIASA
jgi:hypothetical protein